MIRALLQKSFTEDRVHRPLVLAPTLLYTWTIEPPKPGLVRAHLANEDRLKRETLAAIHQRAAELDGGSHPIPIEAILDVVADSTCESAGCVANGIMELIVALERVRHELICKAAAEDALQRLNTHGYSAN